MTAESSTNTKTTGRATAPTRRALLASAPALVAVAAVPATLTTPPADYGYRAFVKEIETLHPNGREVAIRAIEAGAEPKHLDYVRTYDRDHPELMPHLVFKVRGNPDQLISVNRQTAYLWGRV